MKLKKNNIILLSLILGSTMFVTTAFAEVNTKNGYVQLKDALKLTSANCADKFHNFTTSYSYTIKDNDDLIYSNSNTSKYDLKNTAKELTSTIKESNSILNQSTTDYDDNNISISKSTLGDTYNVNEYTENRHMKLYSDQFAADGSNDMEKIADALVGNLQDSLVVTVNSDGSKLLSASLKENQIPSIINALIAYEVRNSFRDAGISTGNTSQYIITHDIYAKSIASNIKLTKEGLVDSILATLEISGKDKNGIAHTFSYDFLYKLSDVNNTTVTKPDLTGKKINKTVQSKNQIVTSPIPIDPKLYQKYLGEYSADIVIEKEDKFIKIGTANVNINEITDKAVNGDYSETYLKGYENYDKKNPSFKFSATNTNNSDDFQFKTEDGQLGHIYMYPKDSVINFSCPSKNVVNMGIFNKVFK